MRTATKLHRTLAGLGLFGVALAFAVGVGVFVLLRAILGAAWAVHALCFRPDLLAGGSASDNAHWPPARTPPAARRPPARAGAPPGEDPRRPPADRAEPAPCRAASFSVPWPPVETGERRAAGAPGSTGPTGA